MRKRSLGSDAQLAGETLSAPAAAKRQDAQGARVVRYCCPDGAAIVRTEDAQPYPQYGLEADLIKTEACRGRVGGVCAMNKQPRGLTVAPGTL